MAILKLWGLIAPIFENLGTKRALFPRNKHENLEYYTKANTKIEVGSRNEHATCTNEWIMQNITKEKDILLQCLN